MEFKKHIVVGFDFSDNSKLAVAAAVTWGFAMKGEIVVLNAVSHHLEEAILETYKDDLDPEKDLTLPMNRLEAVEGLMNGALSSIDRAGVPMIYDVTRETFQSAMISACDRLSPTLFILGATGRKHLPPRAIGTDVERFVRRSSTPVLVVHPSKPLLPKKILCVVDLSPASAAALSLALKMTMLSGATLEVLHVVSNAERRPDATPAAEEILWTQRLGEFISATRGDLEVDLQLTIHILEGVPHEVITKSAQDFDLLCMGSIGRSGIVEVLIGGTSERVMRAMPCSVLLCKE